MQGLITVGIAGFAGSNVAISHLEGAALHAATLAASKNIANGFRPGFSAFG
jgi:hypothetical protein